MRYIAGREGWYIVSLSLSLSHTHTQCVKLLSAQSKKGSTLLHYIVGNRVLLYASRAMDNEVALNKLLRYKNIMKSACCNYYVFFPIYIGFMKIGAA